jgi:hypothetical protein
MSRPDDAISPTPERAKRGPVERTERPVIPTPGDYESPYIAVDILEALLRRGAITNEEKRAGERFRAWFTLAQLDPLRAADFARPYVDGGRALTEPRSDRARREIDKAIRWLGGRGSWQASCLWHMVGLDQSLREWTQQQSKTAQTARIMGHRDGVGVLIAALETLARMDWLGPDERTS